MQPPLPPGCDPRRKTAAEESAPTEVADIASQDSKLAKVSCAREPARGAEDVVKVNAKKMAIEAWMECIDEQIDYRAYRAALESYRSRYMVVEIESCL